MLAEDGFQEFNFLICLHRIQAIYNHQSILTLYLSKDKILNKLTLIFMNFGYYYI